MPPKKKSGKKGKKSGKKSGKKKDTTSAVADVIDELSKEFFILHIKDLERRLIRYQQKYEVLQEANDRDASKFDSLSHDKKQRVQVLKKSLEQRGDEIADLRDRLVGLQQAKESEKESFESQLQQLRTEFQEMKDQLTSENNVLAAKLAALEEFKVAKESLLTKYKSMQEELEQMQEAHQAMLQAIDKKTVMDRDRLKKEMVMRVNQVAAEFRKVSNKQMAETTKRTIRENVSIQTQLAKMADKNAELTQENEETKLRQRKQRRQILQIENNHTDLATRNSSEARVLAMLEEKRKEQEELIKEYEAREEYLREVEAKSMRLKETIEEKREDIVVLARDIELLEEDDERNSKELNDLDSATEGVKEVLEQCSTVLKSLLQAERPSFGSVPASAKEPQAKENETDRSERLLLELLNVLERQAPLPTSALIEDGSTANTVEPSDESSLFQDSYARMQSPGGTTTNVGIRKGSLPPLREETIARGISRGLCEPGVLQLVPRLDQHIPTFVEKTRIRPIADERANDLRNNSVQTISAAQTLFVADQRLASRH